MSWGYRFQLYDPDARRRAGVTGLIFDIQRYAIHDGPGIRTLVFMKGCPLHCAWCANPESMGGRPEVMIIPGNCIKCGNCVRECPCGALLQDPGHPPVLDRQECLLPECGSCQKVCYANAVTISGRYLAAAEVMDQVVEDREFYERTGGGVTFSGGEPMMQPTFLQEMAREAKERGINTAIETCGFAPWATARACLEEIDTVLFDLKHMDSAVHAKFTGVENEIILENLKRIDGLGKPIRARMPLVPGFNDSIKNVRATAAFAAALKNIQGLDILPYHRMGEPKWGQLDRAYQLHGVEPLFEEHARALHRIASEYDIEVTLGG